MEKRRTENSVLLNSGGSRKNRERLVLLFYPGPPDRVLNLFCFFSGLKEERSKEIKCSLKAAKRYLKTDYKIHVSKESPCADHCSVFALGTAEPEFHGSCEHQHNRELKQRRRRRRRRRQRERHKTMGLMSQNNTLHVRFTVLYISLPSSAKQQGALAATTATATKTSVQNITSRFSISFAIISICSTWKMLRNCLGSKCL